MKTRLLYLLSFTAALTLTSCPDNCYDEYSSYNFAVQASFTPEQDSVQVGDTLFLISEFPTTLTPVGSHTQVNYANARPIQTTISVAELSTLTNMPVGAISSFDYDVVTGEMFSDKHNFKPEMDRRLRYAEVAGNYKLRVAFIPKVKGVYAVGFNGGFSEGIVGSDACEAASFEIAVINTDVHINYFESWLKAPVTPIPTNGYWFKVY